MILTNQLHFFITYSWNVLNVNANRMKLFSMNWQRCLNHVFCWSNWKFITVGTASRKKTVAWSYDVEGHALKCVERRCELANKKVMQLYKDSSLCVDDHHFKKDHKFAHKLSWNACIRNELGDQTFYGLPTNLHEQSQDGQELVTDGEQDWSHTFITQVTTDNIVMWLTRLNIADWFFFFRNSNIWRPWGLEIKLGWTIMFLRKPTICRPQLHVQETNVNIPQFWIIWNHFFECWIAHGWTACSRSLGHGSWSVTFKKDKTK